MVEGSSPSGSRPYQPSPDKLVDLHIHYCDRFWRLFVAGAASELAVVLGEVGLIAAPVFQIVVIVLLWRLRGELARSGERVVVPSLPVELRMCWIGLGFLIALAAFNCLLLLLRISDVRF